MMIKKLVSNALLSMVMDKKARDKFTAVQEQKKRKRGDPIDEPATRKAGNGQANVAAKPQADAKPVSMSRPAPPTADEDDPEALIREALESAELEMVQKRKKKPMTSERQALIDQALAIHKSKSHVLDDLDPEHREKLTFMALKTLDPDLGE